MSVAKLPPHPLSDFVSCVPHQNSWELPGGAEPGFLSAAHCELEGTAACPPLGTEVDHQLCLWGDGLHLLLEAERTQGWDLSPQLCILTGTGSVDRKCVPGVWLEGLGLRADLRNPGVGSDANLPELFLPKP